MRNEFVCVKPGRGNYVEIVQDADVCMRTFVYNFFFAFRNGLRLV